MTQPVPKKDVNNRWPWPLRLSIFLLVLVFLGIAWQQLGIWLFPVHGEQMSEIRKVAPPLHSSIEAKGAQLYQIRCQSCHGFEGEGGVANPNAVDSTQPALTLLRKNLELKTPEAVAGAIKLLESDAHDIDQWVLLTLIEDAQGGSLTAEALAELSQGSPEATALILKTLETQRLIQAQGAQTPTYQLTDAGRNLTREPPFPGLKPFLKGYSDYHAVVLNGQQTRKISDEDTAPFNMPGFQNRLSESQLRAITAFLISIPPKTPGH